MLNLGLINNLPVKSEEMGKKPSRKDFSLDQSKERNNTSSNGLSTDSQKTLDKKNTFSENLDKKLNNDKVAERSESDKTNNVKKSYSKFDAKSDAGRKEIQVKDDSITEEDIQSAQNENSQTTEYIIPSYSLNPFFEPQAPAPKGVASEDQLIQEKFIAAINSQNISEENKPVIQFMKGMHQKLGITPQKLVQAFESLPVDALIQSPRKSMDALFAKLELQPGEYTKAQVLFNEMITGLEKQGQLDQFKQVQIKPNIAENFKIQKKELAQINELQPTLEGSPLVDQPIQQNGQSQIATKNPKSTLEQMIQDRILNSQSSMLQQSPRADFVSPMDVKVQSAMAEEPIYDSNFLKKLAELSNAESVTAKDGSALTSESSQENIKEAIGQLLEGASTQKENSEKHSDKKEDSLANFYQIGDKNLDLKNLNTKEFTLDINPQAKKLSPENVDKLISQAQTLTTKGGGEMKIQMTPEGLGTVHLKIKVQDGQVGIQMVTDSADAKKILEGSLQDLKVSLADHKLNLETIKVDVSDKLAQDMLQRDFKREEAREFLNQFRQYNESFRQSASDSSGLVRNYRKASKPGAETNLAPVSTSEGRSSSRRLDLVA